MARNSPAREAKRLATEERRRQVMELRVQGFTMGDIAERLSLSKSTVHSHITKALEDLAKHDIKKADNYRSMMVVRFEKLLNAVWPHATGETISKRVKVKRNGEKEVTYHKNLDIKAVRECRLLIESITRTLGLEVPVKITHTDISGEHERKPSDWVMYIPQSGEDVHQWVADTQAMLKSREATAQAMVDDLLAEAKATAQQGAGDPNE